MKISVVLVHVFSVPFYQPIFGFILGLLRDLGGRRLSVGGEEVFHRELAWVSTSVGVRIWALLIITYPVTFGSPFFVIFSLDLSSSFHLVAGGASRVEVGSPSC